MTRQALRVGAVGTMIVLGATLAGCGPSPAPPPAGQAAPAAGESRAFSYEPYARLLIEHLDQAGLVDYASLREQRGDLDAFVAGLGALDPAVYETWDTDAKIALWINAYNALTLRAIVDHYPIEASLLRSVVFPRNSIRQIPGVWTDLRYTVMGQKRTLDEIEHEILRAEFGEPRIHMALVCAAMSCPPLRWEPYTGERLDAQLEDQSVRFLASPDRFRIDRDANTVFLSSIFDWFGEDFVGFYGDEEDFPGKTAKERAVLAFVAGHLEGPSREFLQRGDYDVEYLDYDWTLNDVALAERPEEPS